jgi:hypothetical protein
MKEHNNKKSAQDTETAECRRKYMNKIIKHWYISLIKESMDQRIESRKKKGLVNRQLTA